MMLTASMTEQLIYFAFKAFIVVCAFVILMFVRQKTRGSKHKSDDHLLTGRQIKIIDLQDKWSRSLNKQAQVVWSKAAFKRWRQSLKQEEKAEKSQKKSKPRVFFMTFDGDIKAKALETLRHEITMVLKLADPNDQVVVRLDSRGGAVSAYGLAAAQMQRLKQAGLYLTIVIDQYAASGGYLMAVAADHLVASPYAMIGSIGVIFQLPNFRRALKNYGIDFEQVTSGAHKRDLTLFGQNTPADRRQAQAKLDAIFDQFKDEVLQNRGNRCQIDDVATGEVWLAKVALSKGLIDAISTIDDVLLTLSKTHRIFMISSHVSQSKWQTLINMCMESVLHRDFF